MRDLEIHLILRPSGQRVEAVYAEGDSLQMFDGVGCRVQGSCEGPWPEAWLGMQVFMPSMGQVPCSMPGRRVGIERQEQSLVSSSSH